ncbi:glycosyltransferase family 4 protein [Maribellus maritimus]|uniref:glycosyltransferase family 4 protein n=1 Tax=Maribellus maritimus TaxID=2870838 RepID=UPI001EEB0555|nr:glycosyltransferase [Maribellus maritimus]MCG6190241.1 glycosyltransferase [Maribellus maritimus]
MMKVLWITNTLFPAACEELDIPAPVVGGWMHSAANAIQKYYKNELQLGIATPYAGDEYKTFKASGISYFLIPGPQKAHLYDTEMEIYWKQVTSEFAPDVVHIYGTEYPHGLSYVNACGGDNVVVFVQGMVSVYERYYFGSIPEKILRENVSLRDRIRKDSLFQQQKNMQIRAEYEKELLKKVNHIIGRTGWDRSHIWAINPKAKYHHNNDTLRAVFYNYEWSVDKIEKHSIFLSQGHYPIKGLHQMIKAIPLILRKYPDLKVYVAGNNFFSGVKKWKISGYGKYILSLIEKYNVKDQIVFTGILTEDEMCKRYLKSNVVVCPSSIENSPNSVGEAHMLGVPTIASYVGGITDLIEDNKTGLLYRFEEYEMLAQAVNKIFDDQNFAVSLSSAAKKPAITKYSTRKNADDIFSIYQQVCKN